MSAQYDVVVVGLGVHGSSLVHELARRGVRVAGIDAHSTPHDLGSSTGRTRITREAYYEHPVYVPLVLRANELWLELEELTGVLLLRRTGGLMCGAPDGELIRGTLRSCSEHDLEHEVLDATAIRARFPALSPPPDAVGILERYAGVLLLDACIRSLQQLAAGYGAQLGPGSAVTSWEVRRGLVTLHTTTGDLGAARVVFAPGSWLNDLLAAEVGGGIALDLEVERQTSHWFTPAPGNHALRAEACPITMLERSDGLMLYTLPDIGHGVKAGLHHSGIPVHPDGVDRTVSLAEEMRMRALLEEWMPGSTHRELGAGVCLYTNTPDRHFGIGRHPAHPEVTLVTACSGHGFKFGPALAELVADVALDGADVSPLFDVSRLVSLPPTGTARRNGPS